MFENNLKVLHPYMPFLTEEIWQYISERTPEEALIIAEYPEVGLVNDAIIKEFEFATDVIAGIRTIRKDKNIAFKNTIDVSVLNNENNGTQFDSVIAKMGNVAQLVYVEAKVDGALSFRVKSNEYFIPAGDDVDIEAEKAKIQEELSYTEGFLKSVQKKLSNERFVNNAPEQVVANEKKKEADAISKIETLKASLASLS